ncbi:hypothetical protein PHISP_02894 [Aspergillus sp. HF37]|nr:hypothetical protein PHISP_02894 [Aspergillus sp. HF37]
MHIFHSRFSLLGCCAATSLLACLGTAQAASGTAEVDLILPQNDTYAPMHIFPAALVFQNPMLASYLHLQTDFEITPASNYSNTIELGWLWEDFANLSTSDPFMQYNEVIQGVDVEDTWELRWMFRYVNCSRAADGNLTVDHYTLRNQRVIFTTKDGAKEPDLSAATTDGTCSNAMGLAFEITETHDSGDYFADGRPCAQLAETTPAPNPCAVTIKPSAASSVAASHTQRMCEYSQTLWKVSPTWCPELKDDEGAARNLVVSSLAVGVVALLSLAFSGLGFLVI